MQNAHDNFSFIKHAFSLPVFSLATLLGISAFFAWRYFEPAVPLNISRETTFIVEPIDEFGKLDFTAAVQQHFSNGVIPENNFLALVAQHVDLEAAPDLKKRLYELLGVPIPDANNPLVYQPPKEWVREHHGDIENFDERTALFSYAYSQPWSADQMPLLRQWLDEMDPVLDRVVDAVDDCEHCYHPIVAETGQEPELLHSTIPFLVPVRNLARGLCIRANGRIVAGDFDGWLRDLLAVKKMGNHVARGHFLVQNLVGVALHSMADQAAAIAIRSGKLNRDVLENLKIELAKSADVPDCGENIRYGEALCALESVQYLSRGRYELIGLDSNNPTLDQRIDWNVVSMQVLEIYEDLLQILESESPAEQFKHLQQITTELDTVMPKTELLTRLAVGSRKSRSQLIGDIVVQLYFPAVEAILKANFCQRTRKHLLLIAAELELYKLEYETYPPKLQDLVPSFRSEITGDLFNGTAYVYKVKGEHYELYSVGANQIDDNNHKSEDWGLMIGEAMAFEQFKQSLADTED